jgi:uncharacterized protein YdiU (UPF0061 family)
VLKNVSSGCWNPIAESDWSWNECGSVRLVKCKKIQMKFPFDNSYSRMPDSFYQRVEPSPVSSPELIEVNRDLAAVLGIDLDWLESSNGLDVLSGNRFPEGSDPIAMAYAGHQFGGFSSQLGDGRALLLGEVVGKDGVRRDIQLKGSGPTQFSRRGDGRSALGPVIREYIVSEAMAALGVPTTRALAAVSSGDKVYRDSMMAGGVFTRVAQSHLRIGTFQYFAAREDFDNLRVLADYAIARHYPRAIEADNPYLELLGGVIEGQAELIAHWMQIGFIHGVMNTDNMSISGETIDFGPCAFLDAYHPEKVFSSIDQQGRYAYANQGPIGHWNLVRFAETLIPLIDDDAEKAVAAAESELTRFPELHSKALRHRLLLKIGLKEGGDNDWELVQELLSIMSDGYADFTLTFRHLSDALEVGKETGLLDQFSDTQKIASWLTSWRSRMSNEDVTLALESMRRANPVFIPRNHRVEEAIAAAYEGDYVPFRKLNELLQRPFEEQAAYSEYELAPKPSEVVCATFCGT